MSDLFKAYDEFLPDPAPSRCPADGATVSFRKRKNSASRLRPAIVFTLGPDLVERWLDRPKLEASIKILWASGAAKGRVALVAMPLTVVGWRLRPSALGSTSSIHVSNYPIDADHELVRQHDRCAIIDVLHDDVSRPALILELPATFYSSLLPLIDLHPEQKSLPAPQEEAAAHQEPRHKITSKAEGLRAIADFAKNRNTK